jgi:Zinc knuckle
VAGGQQNKSTPPVGKPWKKFKGFCNQGETRKCFSCNKIGHLERDCLAKKANTAFVECILSYKPPDAHDKEIIEKSKSEDFELKNIIEWINVLDLVKEIKKEEGKQVAYFNADLVNSEGLIFEID